MPFISEPNAHSFGDCNKTVEKKCGILLSTCANTQYSAIGRAHTHHSHNSEPQRESGKWLNQTRTNWVNGTKWLYRLQYFECRRCLLRWWGARASHLAQCCVIVKLCMDTRVQLSAHLVAHFTVSRARCRQYQVLKCQLCTQHIVCALRIFEARVPMVPSIGVHSSRDRRRVRCTFSWHSRHGTVSS